MSRRGSPARTPGFSRGEARIRHRAAVAQLARASACHAEGRGFESHQPLSRASYVICPARARRGSVTPARNRVTPMGDIEAIPLRGAWTGNRGILHSGTQIVRFHASDLWITCALEFRGRRQAQWQPHHYTFLYFHDEAVSLAAGHRPCAECRRAAYDAYRD